MMLTVRDEKRHVERSEGYNNRRKQEDLRMFEKSKRTTHWTELKSQWPDSDRYDRDITWYAVLTESGENCSLLAGKSESRNTAEKEKWAYWKTEGRSKTGVKRMSRDDTSEQRSRKFEATSLGKGPGWTDMRRLHLYEKRIWLVGSLVWLVFL